MTSGTNPDLRARQGAVTASNGRAVVGAGSVSTTSLSVVHVATDSMVRKPRRTFFKKMKRPFIAAGRLVFCIGLYLAWPMLKRFV